VDEGIVGRLLMRGKNVTQGYYLNAAATQAILHNGWLDTGDLAVMQSGELYITGRLKELIIINGQNYYPHDLEAILYQYAEVSSGKVAVCGVRHAEDETDQLLVFVVHKAKDNNFAATAATIRQVINHHTGLVVEQVVPTTQLPKTTSGKIQRYALGLAYLNGDFSATLAQQKKAPIDEKIQLSQLEAELKQMCMDVISNKSFGVKDNLMELGLSSLALAQIHEAVDARYPDSLELTDFFDYPSIEQLAVHLAEKIVVID
jgi:long-subunit acyl-CoA synthetase (AMP-forming)